MKKIKVTYSTQRAIDGSNNGHERYYVTEKCYECPDALAEELSRNGMDPIKAGATELMTEIERDIHDQEESVGRMDYEYLVGSPMKASEESASLAGACRTSWRLTLCE